MDPGRDGGPDRGGGPDADHSLAAPSLPLEGDGTWPVVAGYEVLGVLGKGGMGVVYKARDPQLDRIVALKLMRPGDFRVTERFQRERRALTEEIDREGFSKIGGEYDWRWGTQGECKLKELPPDASGVF